MKTRLLLAAAFGLPLALLAANNQILGWNNLGMHCMDSDYSVFSILPPYNTIEAQLIVGGKLVTVSNGYTVTYQAVADPSGSINKSSIGKGNWLQYAPQLFGAVAGDQGLPFPTPVTFWMPGASNTPQAMVFEQTNEPASGVLTPVNWFHAYGIPITPYDDAGRKNPYPMMRQIARSGTTPIATNDIVLPVSDEMDCRACHASGTQAAAMPAAGWVWDGLPERDYRLNILRLHDERQFAQHGVIYQAALATNKFNPQGLYRGVVADNKPVLCAACHASEALGGGGYAGIPPLTASVHSFHAHVIDPISNMTLDSSANRSACYRCHPGSTTRCLRGAMGGAIAADGSMEMQCQSCHGNMSLVGTPFPQRVGWFMEPKCQSCHTGTATSNNGQIRYTTCFTNSPFGERIAVNQTFATQSNTPAAGLSLYRFSAGHGGLQCSACHGSTHAEFPATHDNDNVRNIKLQGHAGVMVECTACHTMPASTAANLSSGPHGMHPISQDWVTGHHDLVHYPTTTAQCQVCHGMDYRGTVLSRAQADRSWGAFGGTVSFSRGTQIGCYNCHSGPDEGNRNTNAPPTVNVVSGNTPNNASLNLPVTVTPPTAALRIISQPVNGSLGVSNNVLTYFPNAGFIGSDTFTYAAWDGAKNSTLATGAVAVVPGPVSLGLTAHVPASYPAGWPVAFGGVPDITNSVAPVTYDWDFGDATTHDTNQFATHAYASPGNYHWAVAVGLSGTSATASASGNIVIGSPVSVGIATAGNNVTLIWPKTTADTLLESTAVLGGPANWTAVTNAVNGSQNNLTVTVPASGSQFFRVRRPW